MSMLVRKATVHRKTRGTIKRKPPSSSAPRPPILQKTQVQRDHSQSPILPKKEFNHLKSSENTVVTFSEDRQLYQTSLAQSDIPSSSDFSNPSNEVWIHLQEASKDADNSCDFLCRATDILCHTCFVTLILGILLALPVGMISIGVKYLTECPVQPKIPVYLMVGGCIGLLKLIGSMWKSIQMRRYESMDLFYDANGNDHAFASSTFKIMDTMMTLFLVIWHCVGSYWVFDIWKPHFVPLLHEPSNYCEKTVYMFAACQILGCVTLVCLVIVCLFCLWLCRALTPCFQT